ncbi:ParA family protein [Gulosibacter chungangensis]|uniref:ParA family protein n=1 Tax=Gulosibacter chungangensis TaxID=979746 RepID=A0A7J5BG36_9MICO|nr:ParA family protein [Gulosibacter chungangensis]KAB1645205.1 ParA family protein [Gulosibacter chungangensis]
MSDIFDSPIARQLAELNAKKKSLKKEIAPRPGKTRVLTVSNQKGGVGKTTTTVNLAAALATFDLRVLVIDNDPQGNASTALNIEHRGDTPGTYEVLIEGMPLREVIQASPDHKNLFCCPATLDLAGAEIELVPMESRETRLRTAIEQYLKETDESGDRVDYVFIDCPPSLGLLTINAFAAAEEVLIPIQSEYYALEGLGQLLGSIDKLRGYLNPNLRVSTILMTMFDKRTNLSHDVLSEIQQHFPDELLDTVIPRSVRISEAPSFNKTVIGYDPEGVGAVAYKEAALEMAKQGASTNGN